MSELSNAEILKKTDPKYVDLLDEDPILAGQKFACLSFISPDKILKKREVYFFEKFLDQYDLNNSLKRFSGFLHFISHKYSLNFEKLNADMDDFTKEEIDNMYNTSVADDYKTYIENNEEKLVDKFNKDNSFQTSIQGLKIRGAFPTQDEAELRCKIIRELDPNHDVFVGPVGVWMPWDPEAYKTGRTEYLEEGLNQLMSEKKKNENTAKMEFDKRIREAKRKAIEDNIEKAKASGNVLTQTIDNQDKLTNVGDNNTTENALLERGKIVTDEDIKNELFEGDNIVTNRKTNPTSNKFESINEEN